MDSGRRLCSRVAGRDQPTELKSFEEWAAERKYRNDYVELVRNGPIAGAMKAVLRDGGGTFRLTAYLGLVRRVSRWKSCENLRARAFSLRTSM